MNDRNSANREGSLLTHNPVESRIIKYNGKEFYELKRYRGYFISKDGEILTTYVVGSKTRRCDYSKPRLKKISENVAGYRAVDLRNPDGGRWETVHRLIYETFIGNIPKGYIIDHIDSNRQNCSIDNLRLLKQRDNVMRKLKMLSHVNGLPYTINATVNNIRYTSKSLNAFCNDANIKKHIFNALRAKSQYGKIIPCSHKKYTLLKYSESQETIELELVIAN